MPKSLKRSRGWANLYNQKSSNQVLHTRKAVHFSNGKDTNYNDDLSRVPNSRVSGTSLRKPGAYQVSPTGVVNIDPRVNRRPIAVTRPSPNDEFNALAEGLEDLELEGGSRRKTRGARKQRKSKRSKARKTRRAF